MRYEEARDDLINYYKANSRQTKKLEGRIKLHLTPFFAHRRMAEINGALVNAYIAARLQSGAKPGTINRELAWLRQMYSLAIKAGKLMTKPHISLLREDNARQGFFEYDQFQAVLRELPDDLAAVVRAAYYTGWRKDELLTLRWHQVANGQLRLERSKNGEGRVFPYAQIPELKAVIERQRALHEDLVKGGRICSHVFHRNGVPILSMGKAFKAACRRAGVPGRLIHDFRRTAVRNLELAGVPRSVAMKLTGHKTASVYQRYAIASNADLEVGARKLADLHRVTHAVTLGS